MPSYPQKRLVVNNYHYLYIYIFRVNHKTPDPLDLPNKPLNRSCFVFSTQKNLVACLPALSATFDHRPVVDGRVDHCCVASQFRTSYLEREHSIQVQTEHYVKAMEAHVTYSIQSVDLSLIGFANAIKFLSAKQSRSPETMTELLSSRESCFNSDYWITFIDLTGNAIATSISNIVIGADYKDRGYFTSTSLTAPRANYSWESHRSA